MSNNYNETKENESSSFMERKSNKGYPFCRMEMFNKEGMFCASVTKRRRMRLRNSWKVAIARSVFEIGHPE